MADLNASDILAADWARRAREILERNRTPEAREFRKTSIGRRGPRILEDRDTRSPDQVAADVILGKGTGRLVEDILTGLTPLPGAITEARGGESGILDWVPGSGLVKAGVIAAPKAANILKNVVRTKTDDVADMVKLIAEDVVEQFRHADHVPTRDEISAAVRDATAGMDNGRGIDYIRNLSGDLAENTLNRVASDIRAGRTPSFDIKMPDKINIVSKSLDIDPIGFLERKRIMKQNQAKRASEFFESLTEDEKNTVREQSRNQANEARDKAVLAGISDPEELGKIYSRNYTHARERIIGNLSAAKQTPTGDGRTIASASVSTSADVRNAAKEAYAMAMEQALQQGLDQQESKRIAMAAYARAKRQALADNGNLEGLRESHKAEGKNVNTVYSMFSPEIKDEITREMNAERAAAYQKFAVDNIDQRKIAKMANNKAQSVKNTLTRKLVKELGFKSVNDPRLQQYSVLNRNGAHILADGTVAPVQATPSSILGGALDITDNDRMMQAAYDAGINERPLMAADVAVPYESPAAQILSAKPLSSPSRLLPENEYSDADIAELLIGYGEQPTADAAFNREYAEMLMKEQGY